MGILTRFKDIMSSNINALLDKAEDPEKMIDQCLRNLNSDLGKVKSETAAVMADEQRAKRQLDECTQEINKIQNYAAKAVSAGNDDDAIGHTSMKKKYFNLEKMSICLVSVPRGMCHDKKSKKKIFPMVYLWEEMYKTKVSQKIILFIKI